MGASRHVLRLIGVLTSYYIALVHHLHVHLHFFSMFEVDQKAFVLRIAFLSHLQEWRLSSNLGGLI